MDAGQMINFVERFHENRDFIQNEETVKVALVLPLIKMLGYDPGLPREVRLEFSADFTQGDGKKLADRMDFAIFDKSGSKPLMVIETKPLGTDLKAKSQQLARYIAQLPDLHFGIITDGCTYLFYGDLESPNQMDREPFFSFSLDDSDADWGKIAKFLTKFSRDSFNAETLVTDAENSRYRQGMIDRLVSALRNPAADDAFLGWLTKDIYRGKRTAQVMSRLGGLAHESVEPALVRLMSDDFLDRLKQRIQSFREGTPTAPGEAGNKVQSVPPSIAEKAGSDEGTSKRSVETTMEEIEFFEAIRSICEKAGYDPADLLHRDTINYFNVSYVRPTRWFVRFFGDTRRKSMTTWVPAEDAVTLAPGFEVEPSPETFGVSRVYLDEVAQVWGMSGLVLRSLEIVLGKIESSDPAMPAATAGASDRRQAENRES